MLDETTTRLKAPRVWDLPTRLFHWLLVLLFVFSWYSAENRQMDRHVLSGVAILALIVFRLVWGVVGGSTARFAGFVRAPAAVWRTLRGQGEPARAAGHTALGGYSVVAMLLALLVQVSSGLFAVDVDGIDSGPWSYLISFEQGRLAAEVHEVSFNVLLGLIGLHLLAIAYYRLFRGRRLVAPMITGRDGQLQNEAIVLRPARFLTLCAALVVAATLTWFLADGATLWELYR